MEKKIHFIFSLMIFIAGTLINVIFSTNIHYLLLRKIKVIQWIPFTEGIKSIVSDHQHLALFLSLEGFVLLSAVYLILMNNKPYQSKLRHITPRISTPVPAGQKQFGSAEWLSEKEKDKAFQYFKLNTNDRYIKRLIEAGIKDYKGCEEQYEKEISVQQEKKNQTCEEITKKADYDTYQKDSYIQKDQLIKVKSFF